MTKIAFDIYGFDDKDFEIIGDGILDWCLLHHFHSYCLDQRSDPMAPTIEISTQGFSLTRQIIQDFEDLVASLFPHKKIILTYRSEIP